jgi:hypothetical protein
MYVLKYPYTFHSYYGTYLSIDIKPLVIKVLIIYETPTLLETLQSFRKKKGRGDHEGINKNIFIIMFLLEKIGAKVGAYEGTATGNFIRELGGDFASK